MNWKNTAENLIIGLAFTAIGSISAGYIVHKVHTDSLERVIESYEVLLSEAINKETKAINNRYEIKNKKGTIDFTPENSINDTIRTKKKKFLGIFN